MVTEPPSSHAHGGPFGREQPAAHRPRQLGRPGFLGTGARAPVGDLAPVDTRRPDARGALCGGREQVPGGRPCWRHDPRGQPEHRSLEKVLRGELCRARQRVTHLDSRVSSGQTQGWRGDTGSHRRRAPRQEVGLGLDRRSPGVGRDWDRDLCPPLASPRHPHPQWPPRPGLTGLLRAPQASASPSAPLGTFSDVSPSARPPAPAPDVCWRGRISLLTHTPCTLTRSLVFRWCLPEPERHEARDPVPTD